MRANARNQNPVTPASESKKKTVPTGPGWTLEPHACAECFGRLASRDGVYACTVCGSTSDAGVEAVCCCGIEINRLAPARGTYSPTSLGLRCHPNPEPTPEFPALFVASYGPGVEL